MVIIPTSSFLLRYVSSWLCFGIFVSQVFRDFVKKPIIAGHFRDIIIFIIGPSHNKMSILTVSYYYSKTTSRVLSLLLKYELNSQLITILVWN